MIESTKAIILKTTKYGETSLIVHALTENWGEQSFIINGVRISSKKSQKAQLYVPTAILFMNVYHSDEKKLGRIKDAEWAFLYKNILSDIIKNSVAQFIIELISKSIREPESNIELFEFCEDALISLDSLDSASTANFNLFFALNLLPFLGLSFQKASPKQIAEPTIFADLSKGIFTNHFPETDFYLENKQARILAELLQVQQPSELQEIKISKSDRIYLLENIVRYYQIHVPDFGQMKTLPVLLEIFR